MDTELSFLWVLAVHNEDTREVTLFVRLTDSIVALSPVARFWRCLDSHHGMTCTLAITRVL